MIFWLIAVQIVGQECNGAPNAVNFPDGTYENPNLFYSHWVNDRLFHTQSDGIAMSEKINLHENGTTKKRMDQRHENARKMQNKIESITTSSVADTPIMSVSSNSSYDPRSIIGSLNDPLLAVRDIQLLKRNLTSVWQVLDEISREIKSIRRSVKTGGNRPFKVVPPTSTAPTTPENCEHKWNKEAKAEKDHSNDCQDENGAICGGLGRGRCSCGQCMCKAPYYGAHCQCSDMICERGGGVLCSGPGKGQCRCGKCVCRPQFIGKACECSLSTAGCRLHKEDDAICARRGSCVCNRCQCDEGYHGEYCEESIYSASICERTKTCVLCSAYGRFYPQCSECNAEVLIVDQVESSLNTCVMVSRGCILKYSYNLPELRGGIMKLMVEKDTGCQSPAAEPHIRRNGEK